MPAHRVPKTSPNPLDDLEQKVAELEQAGEQVVQVLAWANAWLIVTHRTRPAGARPVETRATTGSGGGGRRGRRG